MTARITIEGEDVTATSPEGVQAKIPLRDLLQRIVDRGMDTDGLVLPDGTKSIQSRGSATILVHEIPPTVFNFRWIALDSPSPFGRGTRYRNVRIALPYLITLVVYQQVKARLTLSGANECFFRNAPLDSLAGELCYPALLNCSRFSPPDGHPLAWICTQHLKRKTFESEPDTNRRMLLAFKELMSTLLGSGFNYSSEHHEGASWYTETVKSRVDPRILTVEQWEAATAKDPLFVLDVAWLPTRMTVQQIMDRIFRNLGERSGGELTASDLARIIFNTRD